MEPFWWIESALYEGMVSGAIFLNGGAIAGGGLQKVNLRLQEDKFSPWSEGGGGEG